MNLQQKNPNPCFDSNINAQDNENFRTGGFAQNEKPTGDNFQFVSSDEEESTPHI